MTRAVAFAAAAILGSVAAACDREARPFESLDAVSETSPAATETDFHAGATPGNEPWVSPFQENAWGISEGKRLYNAYNCSGCHANGGGGIGPALMDDEWRYGFTPSAIFETIVEGRPNGMPAWRDRLPEYQVWQLVAYVQSLSGQAPIDASTGRSDHMQSSPPEPMRPYQGRIQTGHK